MPVLPVEAYTSQEWFDKEQKYIFSDSWQFAGFVEDLNEPGDYLIMYGNNNRSHCDRHTFPLEQLPKI
ncbi:hypothetical protein Xen7305DRAFT_00025420 [Xenococcus sp. PCC 7305]|nr:hypothetical protein Xen7305DRAFT_00025420 [Xenococcus sp. PCC 7305]